MNFIKWLAYILLGWIMYIPKKIMQKIQEYIQPKAMNWNSIKEFLFIQKQRSGLLPIENVNFDIIMFILLFFGLAILINENLIRTCNVCQLFIGVMSSYFPGMIEISHHSNMPQIVLFVLSFAYAIMPLFVLTIILRNRKIQYNQINISDKRFIYAYLYSSVFVSFIAYISVHPGILFLFSEHSTKRLLDFILMTKIGLVMWIWLLTHLVSKAIGAWVFMNIAVAKKFVK